MKTAVAPLQKGNDRSRIYKVVLGSRTSKLEKEQQIADMHNIEQTLRQLLTAIEQMKK